MDRVEAYVNGSSMQHRDVQDVIEEFSCELSKMRGKCLDIGSGPGDITKEILLPSLSINAEVVGADISQAMVNYAREKYSNKRLSFIVLDIETSELPSDQIENYDNVVSFYCLHWCKDIWYFCYFLGRAFDNIYKLLRPSGKALILFLGYHSGFNAYIRMKQNPRYESYVQDAHRYIPYFQRKYSKKDVRASLRKMLEEIGFEILHCSKRETSYQYSKQSLKNHVYAVNPFINRIPDDMKDEFIDQLVNEIMIKNGLIPFENKNNSEEHLVFTYDLLIAYVQKPPLTI